MDDRTRVLVERLWRYHQLNHSLAKADAILVLCSYDTSVAERAAQLFLERWAPLLIFSGGLGTITSRLWHEPEADQFAAIALRMGVPRENILVENQSANTGENILFTQRLLAERGLDPRSFIVVQKPYMERRSYATFRKFWPDRELVVTSPRASLDEYLSRFSNTALSTDDVISIMVGDLQRVKVYPEKGFQIPQEIPDDVWQAYEALVEAGYDKHLVRPPAAAGVSRGVTRTGSLPGPQVVAFDRACALVEAALTGRLRRDIVAEASGSATLGKALIRLRQGMRTHILAAQGRDVSLERIVDEYDRRTRDEGLHALHDWDGKADTVNDDSIPVDVLTYMIDTRGGEPVDRLVLAVIVDYYFLYILGLLSLRVWDDQRADANLDRVERLLQLLQGPDGSGHQFADNAETLILIATAHYEIEERGYHVLLERVRTLNPWHQTRVALGHAVSMGCHLRFGFEATYGRDTVVMRDDNVADYPWLCFSVAALMREYARLHESGIRGSDRAVIVEGLLNGLSPDARAFVGRPPRSLGACERERQEFAERFHGYKADLLEELDAFRPVEAMYSPMSLFFNFSHNIVKGTVVDAMLRGEPWRVRLNDLLTGLPRRGVEGSQKAELAQVLMAYARSSPDRIRGRLTPVIVYDPQAGRQAFTVMMRKLRE